MSDLLSVEDLSAGYGDGLVLDGLTFQIAEGANLAVLGRNGVGKTTLLETIMGNTRRYGGQIILDGQNIERLPSHLRVKAGVAWVPQEREVFRSLTVEEHLTVAATKGPWTPGRIYGIFPRLEERKRSFGHQLSGGEQQMLAIARALTTNPRLLLLDEPMEGLAPIVVEEISNAMIALAKSGGLTCLLIEQHPIVALRMSHRAIFLERGRIAHRASSSELIQDPETIERFLGVGESGRSASTDVVEIEIG